MSLMLSVTVIAYQVWSSLHDNVAKQTGILGADYGTWAANKSAKHGIEIVHKLDTLLELVTSTSTGLKKATVIIDTPSSLLTRVADVMKRVAHVKPEQLVRGWFVRLKAHLDDKLKRLLDRVRQMLTGGE